MTHTLLIFTRYPIAGKTKTRMIPALGAGGAAQLQRQLTQHTLAQARQWQREHERENTRIIVPFSGGTAEQMQQWLGEGVSYQPQIGEDLGDRLSHAHHTAFAAGSDRIVITGTDCPGLNRDRLQSAFDALQDADVVLGPATDGGYYLIGLRREIPELFVGIDWGSDRVFQQTMAIAHNLNLSVATLDPLPDIDRPEDLQIWKTIQQQTISIILPVLNEENTITTRLQELQSTPDLATPDLEILVVDGGSRDETIALARAADALVLESPPGRARQMNVGAANARGGILLFLHADTRLPPNFAALVCQTLARPRVVAGAFDLQIDGDRPTLRWVERGVWWRSRLLQLPYGDQALFLRAETFAAVGGFPELPIMEDFVLVQQLKQRGRVAIAPAKVLTAARRWEKLGVWRTTWINQRIILGYYLGVSPEQLVRWYRGYNQPR